MTYIKILDNKIINYTIDDLKKEYPHISFPAVPSEELLNSYNIHTVHIEDPPVYDAKNEYIELIEIPTFLNNKWVKTYNILPKKNKENFSDNRENVKSVRVTALKDTDWVVIRALEQGNPVPEAWKTYRQALRDITLQPGFPDNVIWPEPPEPDYDET